MKKTAGKRRSPVARRPAGCPGASAAPSRAARGRWRARWRDRWRDHWPLRRRRPAPPVGRIWKRRRARAIRHPPGRQSRGCFPRRPPAPEGHWEVGIGLLAVRSTVASRTPVGTRQSASARPAVARMFSTAAASAGGVRGAWKAGNVQLSAVCSIFCFTVHVSLHALPAVTLNAESRVYGLALRYTRALAWYAIERDLCDQQSQPF